MALNITIDGFVYTEDGGLSSSNVAYQAYFYKANSGSSASKWNNKRIVENTGYYNINLGDGDWLSQDGSASAGDRIVIVFWSPTTAERLNICNVLAEWGYHTFTLTSASTYTKQAQIRSNVCPNLNWSLPATGLVGQNIVAANSSTDEYQWVFMGTTMYHRDFYLTQLMTINNVNNSDYSWGDGTFNNNLPGTTNGTHSWSSPNDYDVEIVIEDACGCTVTGTDTIRIFANEPVPNIVMTPTDPEPNEPVSFQYIGTDPNNAITNISWSIADSGIYGNTDTISTTNGRDVVVPHTSGQGTDWYGESGNSGAFTNPGNHLVSIVITWWDGFNNQTINYSETFTQTKFSGPTINFTQLPPEASMASGIVFTNTSSDVERVGLGLPDNIEYTWTWTDAGTSEIELDKQYNYQLIKVPTSANCQVELCAEWSDGWDTQTTCLEKDVIFETTVTVSKEDCYYNLNIIGTSEDGSVTGYGWTISSGTAVNGPWTQTWSSPTDLYQNDKKICFTKPGFYKIIGTVYGGGSTSDSEVLYVSEVCPDSEAVHNLWNGTGILDISSDWQHSGHGFESESSKHSGTNGLDASNLSKGDKIYFSSETTGYILARNYDYLRIWVNVQEWLANDKNLEVYFKATHAASDNLAGYHESKHLNLNNYISITNYGKWQKAMIPVADFEFDSLMHSEHDGLPLYLHQLIFEADTKLDLWFDDIEMVIGVTETTAIPVCAPEVSGKYQEPGKKVRAREMKPSMRGKMDVQPSLRIINTPFPGPKNI